MPATRTAVTLTVPKWKKQPSTTVLIAQHYQYCHYRPLCSFANLYVTTECLFDWLFWECRADNVFSTYEPLPTTRLPPMSDENRSLTPAASARTDLMTTFHQPQDIE